MMNRLSDLRMPIFLSTGFSSVNATQMAWKMENGSITNPITVDSIANAYETDWTTSLASVT